MSPTKTPPKSAKKTSTSDKPSKGFTADEKAAMKERAKELKAAAEQADGESAVLAKIAELPAPERAMAKRLHALIQESVPALAAKLWYGMPAYAKDGKNVCFFQSAAKFNTRYATLGFNDPAQLDDGAMWPVAYALIELNSATEAKIAALIKKAVG